MMIRPQGSSGVQTTFGKIGDANDVFSDDQIFVEMTSQTMLHTGDYT